MRGAALALGGGFFFLSILQLQLWSLPPPPHPHPGFWGGAHSSTRLPRPPSSGAGTAGAGGDRDSKALEVGGHPEARPSGSSRSWEKSGAPLGASSCFPALLENWVLGDILPVPGSPCHRSGCDAVRQVDCQDELDERGGRAAAFAFVAVLTPSSQLPWCTCPPGALSGGHESGFWLTSPAGWWVKAGFAQGLPGQGWGDSGRAKPPTPTPGTPSGEG